MQKLAAGLTNLFWSITCIVRLILAHGVFGFAGQAGAGPSGIQSQQAADTHAKAEGAKAAQGKRVAPAAMEDESQVQALLCMTCQHKYWFPQAKVCLFARAILVECHMFCIFRDAACSMICVSIGEGLFWCSASWR